MTLTSYNKNNRISNVLQEECLDNLSLFVLYLHLMKTPHTNNKTISTTRVEVSSVAFVYSDVVPCDVFAEVGRQAVVAGVVDDVDWLLVEAVGESRRRVVLAVHGLLAPLL